MGEEAISMELVTDGDMGNQTSSRTELKRDHRFLAEDAEVDASPNKKQAKEASNEDIRSEVSNPVISQGNTSSFQDITSHLSELASGNQDGSGEVTCLGNSSTEETLSDVGEPSSGIDTSHSDTSQIDTSPSDTSQNDTSRSDTSQNDTSRNDISTAVSTSHVVLEIPKHASTSGIRKITFKFTRRKEDYDTKLATPPVEPKSNVGGEEQLYSGYQEESERSYSTWADSNVAMGDCGDHHMRARNMELKMSKKVVPNNYPTNVKKLLSTGILDGARVKYISNSPKRDLPGIIDGGGYLCGCSSCNYSRVLSAYEFEQHAGAKTRHPNNHIYLENGKPIYSVIQELKTAPFSLLDEVIKDVAGSSVNEEYFQVWKAGLQHNNGLVGADKQCNRKLLTLPDSLVSYPSESLEESLGSPSFSFVQNNPVMQHDYMENLEEWKHVVKKPSSSFSNSVVKQKRTSEGGTKRRDNDLHRLLFMPNGLPDGAELAYFVKGQRILGGYKQGNGIVCSCCDREVSPSQFEAHAGMAARRQPYRHIYTSNGLTLHDIAISLANGQKLTTGESDDMCAICGDGGDLILCGGCPQSFHQACLDLPCAPEGDWQCQNCRDKFSHGRKAATGESSTVDRPIIIRLTRVVKAPEYETGGCVVCRANDFSADKFDDRTVILCDQCEKEFHVGCLKEIGLCDLKEIPKEKWFCCKDCNKIHIALQNSVSKGAEIIPAFLSGIIYRKHVEKGLFIDETVNNVQWRILSGKSRYPEHLPLLSGAAAIFRECFDPIVAKSGRDLIPVMVYGRNISGQEFGGMYCVVLIVKSVVVSAGLLRIFGREVAELPLVATSREHQGKGYFQALFSCVERLLCSLNVEKLVLPAAEEALSIWTKRFGFRRMSEGQLLKYTKELQLTIFKGTSMLEKEVQQIVE